MFFRYFCNYIPLKKGEALHLNKLESPSHCLHWPSGSGEEDENVKSLRQRQQRRKRQRQRQRRRTTDKF